MHLFHNPRSSRPTSSNRISSNNHTTGSRIQDTPTSPPGTTTPSESRIYSTPRIYNPSGQVTPRDITPPPSSPSPRSHRRSPSYENQPNQPQQEDHQVSTNNAEHAAVTETTTTINQSTSTTSHQRSSRRRRRRRAAAAAAVVAAAVNSDVISIPSIPPPTDEYNIFDNEESPPYREQLHKYLDLISFDPRYNIPIIRINKSLIKSDKNLKKSIQKLIKFNLIPKDINLWKLNRIDDNDFETLLPGLLPDLAHAPNDGLYRDLSGIDMNYNEQLELALQLSMMNSNIEVNRVEETLVEVVEEQVVEEVVLEPPPPRQSHRRRRRHHNHNHNHSNETFSTMTSNSEIFYDANDDGDIVIHNTTRTIPINQNSCIPNRPLHFHLNHHATMLFNNGMITNDNTGNDENNSSIGNNLNDERYRGFRYNAAITT